ncbi:MULTISPECIES: decarboxylating NADP(+)-dependent phosphogluconate dehydrogenase [unclassified Oceanispirochaeta]|uniref:decarboxylating NADP(+)-dependent phosphogluconate dehydrogenase n=1 Tax=unclassified Oceanispirochaeta TaxID=2635722 RepID=UPI0014952CD3|nr:MULTISPECIES: decarboxylating NADP(+)-dependent phosphogluconate dehydrogenase [unclassified Oceanispirochaeta]MBF9015418.1 decarboxylating NADP(+)-dependent phosphogluconate dehydrogenase [Oceanispirochaeta sp. M2]
MNADIGLVGLAVMGQNLVLNMNDNGYTVAVYNRTEQVTKNFLAGNAAGRETILGMSSLKDLAASLKRPRKVMIMVKAGAVVDMVIQELLPYLEKGDIIIDGGNSHYPDSTRRMNELKEQGILFVGSGVSGGEEGARRGPSLMPGGNPEAWPHIKEILQAISAKVDGDPCCDWVGEEGAGHYVKMVHNGIEYGDMQLIGEAFQLMKDGMGLDYDEMSSIFKEWNNGALDSYLIEITRDILAFKDSDGAPLVEKIKDSAGQKGTGKWTGIAALDTGIPLTLIAEAVFSRCLSSIKDERERASKLYSAPEKAGIKDRKAFLNDLEQALLASKLISYAQGFMLLKQAAGDFGWKLNFGAIALMWRGGCIIRSTFLGDIKKAFDDNPDLENLLQADYFKNIMEAGQASWRRVVIQAVEWGIPLPAMSSALAFFDGYRTARLPASLLQAQRDYFGAHSYERLDKPEGEFFHTDWTGQGGGVAASTYNA